MLILSLKSDVPCQFKQSVFGTLDFSQVFTDGDASGQAGYWVGYLDVDFDAPTEPYLSFDFAEIGTKQILLTSCPGEPH